MIKFIRLVALPVWALVVGLAVFTTETVADELGWTSKVREFVRAGPAAMFDSSYDTTIVAMAWFLSGVLAISWGEWAFRKWEAKRKVGNWQHFTVNWKDGQPLAQKHVGVAGLTMLDGQVMGNVNHSDPKVSRNAIALIIQFDREIADPCPYVFSDRKVIWREVESGDHFLVMEVDLRTKDDAAFGVIVRPKAWSNGEKFDAAMRWHDAHEIPHEKVLEAPKSERHWPQWLPDIAGRKRH
ncbi:hypothetical protein [Tsuneonella flava]|uniref:hypothetical protein n=1 Tax=Tsuneonella flava TaxID=2055955 RepID=UPI000F4CD724|nr:hypothetical protein [Tsuneonella flava]